MSNTKNGKEVQTKEAEAKFKKTESITVTKKGADLGYGWVEGEKRDVTPALSEKAKKLGWAK